MIDIYQPIIFANILGAIFEHIPFLLVLFKLYPFNFLGGGGGGGSATIRRPLKLTTMVVFRDNLAHMVVIGRFLFKFQSAVRPFFSI